MKYMLMMLGTRSGWESMGSWTPDEFKAHIEFMLAFNKNLVDSGEFVLAEGLDVPGSARVVQARPSGRPIVSDGPFPESKEFLAGFWIVDVQSAERAYELAGIASSAPGKGGKPVCVPVEVRAVPSGPPPTG